MESLGSPFDSLGAFGIMKLHVSEFLHIGIVILHTPGPVQFRCMDLHVSDPGACRCETGVPTAGSGAFLIREGFELLCVIAALAAAWANSCPECCSGCSGGAPFGAAETSL